ncbi:MAG: amidohydrolase family protein [Candidatus Sulfotelmatobacter sp.]
MRESLARAARRCAALLVLLAAVRISVVAIPAPSGPNTPPVTALVNVTLVPMDRERLLPGQTVIVRGGRIAEIGPANAIAVPADAIVVDGTGRYLTPGLADMHVHLDSLVQARPNFGDAPLFLAYGITTVLNLRGEPEHLAWRQRIRNGELLAPNLYTSGEFINEPRERTPEEVEREVVSQFRAGYDVIKYHQIVDAEGRYLTTSGLSRAAYMRMNEVARRLGIPLLGHAPTHLGLSALLEARQSLAHVGEFIPLYFLPPDPRNMNLFFLVSAAALLLLLISCATWAAVGMVRRARNRVSAVCPAQVSRTRKIVLAFTVFALVSMVLSTLLILSGNIPLLIMATVLWLVMAVLAIGMVIAVATCWRRCPSSAGTNLHLALLTVAILAFLSATAYWLPILWRSSDTQLAAVAGSACSAGIWVETTLNLYDDMSHQQRVKLLQDPAFKALPPDIRDDWTAVAGQDLLPAWQMIVFRNYPSFTRRLTSALHKAGVPLLLGTDALGAPLAIPGASAHQELQLLVESGFTPYEALRTATVNPAKFLGKEDEFGTITVGKRADLLLVSANPLVDIHALQNPVGVMVRGQWLPAEKLQGMLRTLAH